jgi:hypothetical protein
MKETQMFQTQLSDHAMRTVWTLLSDYLGISTWKKKMPSKTQTLRHVVLEYPMNNIELFHCCYKKFVIFLLLDEKAVNENGLSFY